MIHYRKDLASEDKSPIIIINNNDRYFVKIGKGKMVAQEVGCCEFLLMFRNFLSDFRV